MSAFSSRRSAGQATPECRFDHIIDRIGVANPVFDQRNGLAP
jgi:hypothetical protein